MDIVQLSMFDGKVCTKCKQEKPRTEFYRAKRFADGLRQWCKECDNADRKRWADENRDAINAQRRDYNARSEVRQRRLVRQHRYYSKNRDEIRAKVRASDVVRQNACEYMRQMREQDPEKSRESNRQSYHRRRDQRRAELRERYARNRAQIREIARLKYAANPEPVKEQGRAWRRANPEKRKIQTHKRRARKLAGGAYTAEQWRCLCEWFGNVCLACGKEGPLSPDHVVPLALHGTNTIDNLQPLCLPCNLHKHTKATDYRDPERLAAFLEYIHDNDPQSAPHLYST